MFGITEGEYEGEVATSRKSRVSLVFYRSLAFYFTVPSAIQVAAAHPCFDLCIGDQRGLRDPKPLSRLRDECLLIRRENTSRHKGNHERNQKSHPTKQSERTNELIGHTHLQQNSF